MTSYSFRVRSASPALTKSHKLPPAVSECVVIYTRDSKAAGHDVCHMTPLGVLLTTKTGMSASYLPYRQVDLGGILIRGTCIRVSEAKVFRKGNNKFRDG